MLLGNSFGPDPRVLKEATSLVRNGAEVTILAWDRERRLPLEESMKGIQIKRLRVRSRFGRGIGQLPFLVIVFSRFVVYGIFHRFDVIHAHDFDTLPAGVLIKIGKLFRIKLVYDSHENFPVQKALELPAFAFPLMNILEKLCIKFVDQIFTASSILQEEFSRKYSPPVVWLPNFADKDDFSIPAETIAELRRKIGFQENDFVVAYIGGLRPARAITPLIAAVAARPSVKAFICGSGEQRENVGSLARATGNVKYLGGIPQSDVVPYYFACDILYYGLIDYPGAVYNAPNNFSYAMLAEKPIIGTGVGDLGRFVRESGCGIVINEATEENIGSVLDILSNDPSIYKNMRDRVHSVGKIKYHWGVVEQRLLVAYATLLNWEINAQAA